MVPWSIKMGARSGIVYKAESERKEGMKTIFTRNKLYILICIFLPETQILFGPSC